MFTKSAIRQMFSIGLIFLIIFSLSANTFGQSRDNREKKKIELGKDQRQNGYRVIKRGDQYFINIINVVNPETGKKLSGEFEFVYRCKLIAAILVISVILVKGQVERKIQCALEPDPPPYVYGYF